MDEIRFKLEMDSISMSELAGRIKLLYRNSHFEVNKDTYLTNENGKILSLKDIAFDGYLFIIRFSEFNCISCITEEMQHVSNFLKSNQNVICIVTYDKQIDLLNTKRTLGMSFPIFNIPFASFNNEMEIKKLPYYFILDKNYHVNSLFIADPNNYKLTDDYLNYISTLLKGY